MSEDKISSIKCPFVPNHIVPYDRFLNHVDKCKYPGKIHYSKCRFNPFHIIHKDHIVSHQEKCPERNKYKPIEDDTDEWWGLEQKPQKISTPVQEIIPNTQNDEQQQQIESQEENEEKTKKQDKQKEKKVEILDFELLDFSNQGI